MYNKTARKRSRNDTACFWAVLYQTYYYLCDCGAASVLFRPLPNRALAAA